MKYLYDWSKLPSEFSLHNSTIRWESYSYDYLSGELRDTGSSPDHQKAFDFYVRARHFARDARIEVFNPHDASTLINEKLSTTSLLRISTEGVQEIFFPFLKCVLRCLPEPLFEFERLIGPETHLFYKQVKAYELLRGVRMAAVRVDLTSTDTTRLTLDKTGLLSLATVEEGVDFVSFDLEPSRFTLEEIRAWMVSPEVVAVYQSLLDSFDYRGGIFTPSLEVLQRARQMTRRFMPEPKSYREVYS